MLNIRNLKDDVMSVINNNALTHEQAMTSLSSIPMNHVQFFETTPKLRELVEAGVLCTMTEGNALYCPRYILPDYEKLMREGCKALRLDPPTNLWEAVTALLIMYRHVPSVTHYPVYIGNVDMMLEPFIEDEEEAKKIIRHFMFFLDRTIPDSYCHMNVGPEATRAGRIILEVQKEFKDNAMPSISMKYDADITPDDFAVSGVECALACAKPSFANHKEYNKLYDVPYGIASCYNALPVGGGAFTLSRVVLSKMAERAYNSEHLIETLLPEAVAELCNYMEQKITFLVEETHFFKSNFLVKEGFLHLDRFTGMFGMVGTNECVNILMEKDGKTGTYGYSEEADALAKRILDKLTECVESYESRFCDVTDHRFSLHAQVGISEDYDISPGVRIAIGDELPLHEHLIHCSEFHPYFKSGVGDIFPFDETAKRNPEALLDMIKGGFDMGMRYFSTYGDDADVIRITGYLVKKSDIAKLDAGENVHQANAMWGLGEVKNSRIYERKVRSLD